MACFFKANVQDFLSLSDEQVLARLSTGYANRGYTTQYSQQTLTWERDIRLLRQALEHCVARSDAASGWGLLFEFSIPRKEKRIDIVLLVRGLIVLLEAKTGHVTADAKRQVEEYGLLLHYFHKPSSDRRIAPILVSENSSSESPLSRSKVGVTFGTLVGPPIAQVTSSSWESLSDVLIAVEDTSSPQMSIESWDGGGYFPVPSIFNAAIALRSGLSIREIAQSEASEYEIESVRGTLQAYVDQARAGKHFAICFLTGVPGSGKTLVGLSLAHSVENSSDAIHFMSGNGPLVRVLQHLFTKESQRVGKSSAQARTEAATLIENVHVFARHYTDDYEGPPSNHAVIFDEAQRAWNRAQNNKKFKRDYSEPDMLLRVMERHDDWAVVVALVGGGQEINDGEAGLEEWGRALLNAKKNWLIHASPEVLVGGISTANHRLFPDPTAQKEVQTDLRLHLRTSNRSLRAEKLSEWVNFVIDGDAESAASLKIRDKFPIMVSRDLEDTRSRLRERSIGFSRSGLVGSSAATRLRAEGLEPSSSFHSEYPWEHWYLGDKTDVRSSFQCEVFATEFEIQGLELDWVGLCWGGDFIWDDARQTWLLRTLRHGPKSKWTQIKNTEKQAYRRNAYRVLLTRARQGMVIFIPKGDSSDPTVSPAEFEATATFLHRCGAACD